MNDVCRKCLSAMLAVLLAQPLCGLSGYAYADDRDSGGVDSSSIYSIAESRLASVERAEDAAELGFVPGEIVVVYEEGVGQTEKEEAVEVIDGVVSDEITTLGIGTVATVDVSDDLTVETAANAVVEEPAVRYAFPNYVASPLEAGVGDGAGSANDSLSIDPNTPMTADQGRSLQWYLDSVGADGAWRLLDESCVDGDLVKIAVIDTGASLNHPDLENVIDRDSSIEVLYAVTGYTTDEDGKQVETKEYSTKPLRGDGYTNGSSTVTDYASHGTHVSGIIAAEAGNGGIVGVASGAGTSLENNVVELVVADVFSSIQPNGASGGTVYEVLKGLDCARDSGCSVVNLSLGFDGSNSNFVDAFEAIVSKMSVDYDMVFVAAAGNDGVEAPMVPAACPSVLGVISLTSEENCGDDAWGSIEDATFVDDGMTRSAFSNYGSWCDISAPGENLYSTFLNKGSVNTYKAMSGTSMASPVVAAVAGLVRRVNPDLSAKEVRTLLCETARDLYATGKDDETGWGAIDAEAAVAAAVAAESPAHEGLVIDASNVTLSSDSMVYSGIPQRPAVRVRVGEASLVEGRDYSLSWSSSSPVNVGSYSVTITGIGGCKGNVAKSFRIVAKDLSGASISVSPQIHTGAALRPSPVVKLSGVVLANGVDYAVSYTNNINVGNATLIVSGMGNYIGTARGSFAIKAASNGWQKVGSSMRYRYASGAYAIGWAKINGRWYYFFSNADMATGWRKVGGKWFYLDPTTGAMRTGWQKIGGGWYYLTPGDSGAMRTGWQKIDGSWYYLTPGDSGRMKTGWQKIGGRWYYLTPGDSGRMKTGWQKISGKWYYLTPGDSGHMVTGWQVIGGKKYYFLPGDSGIMVSGVKTINGRRCVFDSSGALVR